MATYNGTPNNDTFQFSEAQVNGNASANGSGGIDTLIITSPPKPLFSYFNLTFGADGSAIFKSIKGGASGFTLTNVEKIQYKEVGTNAIVTMDLATYIVGFTPGDAATGVAVNSDIVLTFNETITRGTVGNITITDAAGTIVETFSAAASQLLTFSGKTLTINPTKDLASSTHYFVNLDAKTVTSSVAGHIFSGTTATSATTGYDFTTAAAVTGVSVAAFLTAPITSKAISDTATNIASKLDALHANVANITGITLTDATPLAISATQLSADADVLTKISSAYTLTITDTSANIATNIDALGANVLKIVSIVQTGVTTPLAITGTQFTKDSAVFLKFIAGYSLTVSDVLAANVATVLANSNVSSITVNDSGASISAILDLLQTNVSKITSITVSDIATPLAITATQLTNDSAVLAKISGNYTLSVSGVTTANFATVIGTAHVATVVLADSGASISAILDALQTNVSKITSITLNDVVTPLALTATQLANDGAALGKISGAYTLNVSGVTAANYATVIANAKVNSVVLTDTGANIVANLDALQANANLAKITSITVSDISTPLALTATQLANDAAALAKISSAYTLNVSGVTTANYAAVISNSHVSSVVLTDTGANIVANLNALQVNANLAKIASITVSDFATALAITATQVVNDAVALAKISSAYTLNVSGVTTANYAAVISNTHVNSVVLNDTGANVVANLNALQTNVSKITSITVSDIATPLAITAAQLVNDGTALGKISGAYTLNVSGVTTANYASVISNTHVNSVVLNDTGANVVANLNALQVNANLAKITSIVVSDIATPLALTATQLANDGAALAKISSAYTLNVSGVTTANYATVIANTHVNSVALVDTGAAIGTAIDALQSNAAKISSIIVTDIGNPIAITATQVVNDADVLNKISGAYNLNVSGVTTANVDAVVANGHAGLFVLTDTSVSIAQHLSLLLSDLSKINSITITGGPNEISLSSADASTYASVLAKIPGVHVITSQLIPVDFSGISTPIDIYDSSTNVSAKLDVLQTNVANINSITTSDAIPLTVTVAQIASDATVLSKINGGNYTLNVSNVSWDQIGSASLLGNVHVTNLDIADTPANISANLDALQGINSKIGTINIAYGSGPHTPISLTPTQLVNDAQVIQKIVGLNDPLSVPFTVTGNTASIGQNFTALNQYVNIIAIVRTDVKAILSITNDQFKNDTALLNKLGTKYSVSITDAVADKVTLDALLKTLHVVSTNVVDTASNISTNLDYLNSKVAKIGSIHLTDSNPIAITAKQFAADTKLLAKIADNYSLDVSGVAAGGLVKLLTDTPKYVPHVHNVTIADSSLNIAKNLNALQTNIDKITSITQTGKAADLKVTALQVELDKGALDKIVGNYTLAVSDTSANVSTEIDKLQDQFTNNHFLPKTLIKLTDKAPVINVTAHQFEVDHDVLNQIAGKFNINIDAGVSSAETLNFSANIHGAPSATHFDSVTGWSIGDTITYSNASGNVLLTKVDISVASLAKAGTALIDTSTAHVTFNAIDNATLAKQIAAVEKAFGLSTTHDAGQVAIWTDPNGTDTEVLIRDAHTVATAGKVGVGDELIKLVGVTADHVALQGGVIIFQ